MKLSVLPIAVIMTQAVLLFKSNLLQEKDFFFPEKKVFQAENIFKEDSDSSPAWTFVITEASMFSFTGQFWVRYQGRSEK